MKPGLEPEHSARGTGEAVPGRKWWALWLAVVLLVVLSLFFRRSFERSQALFSNDTPLGEVASEHNAFPAALAGTWQNLNWLGAEGGPLIPSVALLRLVASPQMFGRIYGPVCLLMIGLCAGFCLQRLQLAPLACLLGGMAAALNSDFFSAACWGVGAQVIAFAANFVALGLLVGGGPRLSWVKVMLAGLAVGLGVMEAYDIGVIFSLLIAAFALYQALFLTAGTVRQKAGCGVARVGLMAAFAVFIAAYTIGALIETQIKGVADTQQDEQTREERWDWATQWSLPKQEALGLVVPGLFGYRMNSPGGGNYWGAVGRDPAWDRYLESGAQGAPPTGFLRFTGGSAYAGVLVVLVALWAGLQSLRGKALVFTRQQRKAIWFWMGVVLLALLLAFGRFAPFYRFFYALPYCSTIRNPTKFLHVLSFALVILFGYGVDGLWRTRMARAAGVAPRLSGRLKSWWAAAERFDKRCVAGALAGLAASLLAWLFYASWRPALIQYLVGVRFDEATARAIAAFSVRQVGWFVLLLALNAGLLTLVLSGEFAGRYVRRGGILLAGLLLLDLGVADQPWIVYWDIGTKYGANPIIDLLRTRPYEQRVTILPFGGPGDLQNGLLRLIYHNEWLPHLFRYYDIQALDTVQEPRVPVEHRRFLEALPYTNQESVTRTWVLTNTRYLLSRGGTYLEALNRHLDPQTNWFRLASLDNGQPASFNFVARPGTASTALTDFAPVLSPTGQLAVLEYVGALPRAQLFSNWQVNTNDEATLQILSRNGFDPHQTVLVSEPVPGSSAAGVNGLPGSVEIKPNYRSKEIELAAEVKVPAVLLLNERFTPKWRVWVDGRPEHVLRCNYVMRGVYLPPGRHDIRFRFVVSNTALYVSLAAAGVGLILGGWLAIGGRAELNSGVKPLVPV